MQTGLKMGAVVKCSHEQKHKPPLRFSFSLFLRVSSGWETKRDKEIQKKKSCMSGVLLLNTLDKTTQLYSISKCMWDQAACMLSSEPCDGKRLSHLGLRGLHRWRLRICSLSHPAVSSPLSLYPPAASSVQPAPPVQQRRTGWEDTFYRRCHPLNVTRQIDHSGWKGRNQNRN